VLSAGIATIAIVAAFFAETELGFVQSAKTKDIKGCRRDSVATAHIAWNALPVSDNAVSASSVDSFRHQLKTFLGSGDLSAVGTSVGPSSGLA